MPRGVFAVGLAAVFLSAAVPTVSAGRLETAIVDPGAYAGAAADTAFARTAALGATVVKLHLVWPHVAPASKPANPADPAAYNWANMDAQVRRALDNDLEPIIYIQDAPPWARQGIAPSRAPIRPDPTLFGQFARAAATRYDGSRVVNGKPQRVRYWQAWNEPNRDYYLMPQFVGGRIFSPAWYRSMLNNFAAAVHAVHSDSFVIAGGLAPLGRPGKPAPLRFMRSMLCMSGPPYRRTCSARSQFDVWAHHPYTSGGPTHQAPTADDVSLGDLPQMRRLLVAARRAGRIISSRQTIEFWVTEFSWDSNPPDPKALGAKLHARWVSEALYRMWRIGIPVVTWYLIQDHPLAADPYQSGFYDKNGNPKFSLEAFRFPFVAFRQRRGVYVWGRTPSGQPGSVVVERSAPGGWRAMGTLNANANGMFARLFRTPLRRGLIRARFATEVAVPFSLVRPRDRYVNPFGCGGAIPC